MIPGAELPAVRYPSAGRDLQKCLSTMFARIIRKLSNLRRCTREFPAGVALHSGQFSTQLRQELQQFASRVACLHPAKDSFRCIRTPMNFHLCVSMTLMSGSLTAPRETSLRGRRYRIRRCIDRSSTPTNIATDKRNPQWRYREAAAARATPRASRCGPRKHRLARQLRGTACLIRSRRSIRKAVTAVTSRSHSASPMQSDIAMNPRRAR
jgi:hypothetical protein